MYKERRISNHSWRQFRQDTYTHGIVGALASTLRPYYRKVGGVHHRGGEKPKIGADIFRNVQVLDATGSVPTQRRARTG